MMWQKKLKLEQARAPETTLMRSLKYAWPWNWQKSKVDHEILSCCDTFLTETQRSDSIIEFKRIILIIKSSSLYSKLCLSKNQKKFQRWNFDTDSSKIYSTKLNDYFINKIWISIITAGHYPIRVWASSNKFYRVGTCCLIYTVWNNNQIIALSEIMNLPDYFGRKGIFQRTIKILQKVSIYLSGQTI